MSATTSESQIGLFHSDQSTSPQRGYDSDAPEAFGEVGRVGMAVDTLRDFEIAFDGIDLEKITVSLTINGSAAIMIAMYVAMAEKRGYDLGSVDESIAII